MSTPTNDPNQQPGLEGATDGFGNPYVPPAPEPSTFGQADPFAKPAAQPDPYAANPYGQPDPYAQQNPYGQPQAPYGQQPFGQPTPYGYVPPYGQAPYGSVAGVPYYAATPPSRNGLAIASMVLGISSCVLFLVFFIAWPAALVGLILGLYGLRAAGRHGVGKGFAIAGVVTSIVGLLASTLIGFYTVRALVKCADGPVEFGSPAWEHCVDHYGD